MEDNKVKLIKFDEDKIAYGRIMHPTPYTSLIWHGNDGSSFEINIDKKFNWFQKKMLKIFFGFEVKENK